MGPEARYTVETLAGVVGDMVKAAEMLNSFAPGDAVGQTCLEAAKAAAEWLRATIESGSAHAFVFGSSEVNVPEEQA